MASVKLRRSFFVYYKRRTDFMEVIYKPVGELIEYEGNARRPWHDTPDEIKQSKQRVTGYYLYPASLF